MQCYGDCCIGGATRNAAHGNPFSAASQEVVDFLYDYYAPRRHAFFTTNNLCVPRDGFLAIGGFDESFPTAAAEDRDFCDRWKSAGRKLHYAPEAVVLHEHVLGPASFVRQHFAYGRGALRFHRRREERGRNAPRLEPLEFYTRLLRRPFRTNGLWRGLLLSGLLAASQVANAGGYACERLVSGRARGRSPVPEAG